MENTETQFVSLSFSQWEKVIRYLKSTNLIYNLDKGAKFGHFVHVSGKPFVTPINSITGDTKIKQIVNVVFNISSGLYTRGEMGVEEYRKIRDEKAKEAREGLIKFLDEF